MRKYGAEHTFRLVKFGSETLDVGTTGQGIATTFKLRDFVSAGTLSYDYYQIRKAVVKITQRPTAATDVPVTDGTEGACWNMSCIDLDDKTPLTTYTSMENNATMRMWRSNRQHTRVIRPVPHFDVERGQTGSTPIGGAMIMGRNRNVWLNTAYNDIVHYGLKFWLGNNTGHKLTYDFVWKIYVRCKCPIMGGM